MNRCSWWIYWICWSYWICWIWGSLPERGLAGTPLNCNVSLHVFRIDQRSWTCWKISWEIRLHWSIFHALRTHAYTVHFFQFCMYVAAQFNQFNSSSISSIQFKLIIWFKSISFIYFEQCVFRRYLVHAKHVYCHWPSRSGEWNRWIASKKVF